MLDRLVDVLLEFLDLFRFWEIIEPTEVGLIYTLGRDTSVIRFNNGFFNTGFHFIAPFQLETVTVVNIQWNWDSTSYQSLTTKDEKSIICQIAYKYRLVDEDDKVRINIVGLDDEVATRRLTFGAAVAAVVEESTFEEVRGATEKGMNHAILELARKELNQWGYKLAVIEWIQRTPSRTYRLMQDQVTTVNQISTGEED